MPALLWADDKGRIWDHPELEMVGYSGWSAVIPEDDDLVALPDFSRLFYLPGCPPVGLDPQSGKLVRLNRVRVGRNWVKANAVTAFLAPGWTRTLLPAADYSDKQTILPMWGYTAVGLADDGADGVYVVPAFQVEDNPTWNPSNFDDDELVPKLQAKLARRPNNRLYHHLARCATDNHCFAAKNLFLSRWEAPLPVSRTCNAACLGCLSLQEKQGPEASHHRIAFRPTPEEVAEVALDHLANAPEGIISFGQGCEGEPLTEADLIEKAIKLIRAETDAGVINLNTNGSDPKAALRLIKAGLDSIRVSLISAREDIFNAYVQPKGYGLAQARETIAAASRNGLFTMINYLVFPGVNDQEEELIELIDLIKETGVNFIHLKNLCIDPAFYLEHLDLPDSPGLGLANLPAIINREVPQVRFGYFNQPAAPKVR